MTKKALLTPALVFALFMTLAVRAQETKIPKTAIGFVPQYALAGGIRMDIDKSVSRTSNQWLVFSPQVYASWEHNLGRDFNSLWGLGLDVKHRIYLKNNNMRPDGFYFQYGPNFQFYSIDSYQTYLEPYMENGIQYYRTTEGDVKTSVYKYGANFHVGYQAIVGEKVFFDFYAGTGIRLSFDNRNDGFHPWFNNWYGDYGYSGTLLDGGIRVGIVY